MASASSDLSKQKLLFTPGPLNTTMSVKEAMLLDYGSRDVDFVKLTKDVREGLLEVAGVQGKGYESVIMQGCGSQCLEAVITSIIPRENAKAVVFAAGVYGRRLGDICKIHDIPTLFVDLDESKLITPQLVEETLKGDDDITHVIMVHLETTAGAVYDVQAIGEVVSKNPSPTRGSRTFFVDSMAMFGAMVMDLDAWHIDALVSSANKCIQGVPGFSFAILRRRILEEVSAKLKPRTLSLDLYDQWKMLEASGQFRFTPPTHSLLAFNQALKETRLETVAGRAKRYTELACILIEGMRALGFQTYQPDDNLPPKANSYIITAFLEPKHDNFSFGKFSQLLTSRGIVVYPGKVAGVAMFRVGHIGSLQLGDAHLFVKTVQEVKAEMGF